MNATIIATIRAIREKCDAIEKAAEKSYWYDRGTVDAINSVDTIMEYIMDATGTINPADGF